MAEFRLGLRPEDNPKLQVLVDEYNRLNDRFANLNQRLLRVRVPVLRPWRARRVLDSLGPEILEFEKEWNKWNQEARDFSLNPHLFIQGGGATDLAFIHFTAEFRMRITDVEAEVRFLREIFNGIADEFREQRNLLIALSGIILSLLGLSLALLK